MMPDRDDQIHAAEFVLGLLEPEAHAAAERRLSSDPAFAREVAAWQKHFTAFDDTADPVVPADELWRRIEAGMGTAAAAPPVAPTGLLPRFWNSLGALRIAALSGVTAALALAVVTTVTVRHAQEVAARKPVYVAILVDDATRQAGAIVNAFADGRVEMIPLVDMTVPAGRSLQVWTLWNREVGPRSVGLLERARATSLDLERLPSTAADQLFEITLEPSGGSPTGRPTGPILYKGTTARTL
ncbi:anti-sigma factor [Reyranella sp.]|uniref:anti-sigma factor n=1 Tax=Reyranella sp. TaxID=1929291 RepID=UPI003BAC59D2